MTRVDEEQKYRKWWLGKRVRTHNMNENDSFIVTDVKFHGSPSAVYGFGELKDEKGNWRTIWHGDAFKPRKSDVVILNE